MVSAIETGQDDLAQRLRGALVLASLPLVGFTIGLQLASVVLPNLSLPSFGGGSLEALEENVALVEPAAPEPVASEPAQLPPAVAEPEPKPELPEPPSPPAPGDVQPLSPTERAHFYASPIDRPPAFLDGVKPENYDKHFIASDEWNHHLYAPHLRDLGGGYIGVGATQGYVLIGWARPEYAWFIDYDDTIVELHGVWRVLFELAPTPDQFVRLWSWEERKATIAAMKDRLDGPDGAALVAAYRRHRARVSKRLTEVRTKHLELRVDSYLTDDETFDYVRGMVLGDRVRPMRVDLTASRGLAGIAEAARALSVTIRVLYTSNAQTYWRYPEGNFPANVLALPFDERSVVAHTIGTHSTNGDYRYLLHHGAAFQDRMREGARGVYRITPWRRARRGSDIEVERVGFEL